MSDLEKAVPRGFLGALSRLRGIEYRNLGENLHSIKVSDKELWQRSLPELVNSFFPLIQEGYKLTVSPEISKSPAKYKAYKLHEVGIILKHATEVTIYTNDKGQVLGFWCTETADHDPKILISRDIVVDKNAPPIRITRKRTSKGEERERRVVDALYERGFELLENGTYDAIVGVSANPRAVRTRRRASDKHGAITLFGIETTRLGLERQKHLLKAVEDLLDRENMLFSEQPPLQYRGLVHLQSWVVPPLTEDQLRHTPANDSHYGALSVIYSLQQKSAGKYIVAGHLISVRRDSLTHNNA